MESISYYERKYKTNHNYFQMNTLSETNERFNALQNDTWRVYLAEKIQTLFPQMNVTIPMCIGLRPENSLGAS